MKITGEEERFKSREIKRITDRGPKIRMIEFSLEAMQAITLCSNIFQVLRVK